MIRLKLALILPCLCLITLSMNAPAQAQVVSETSGWINRNIPGGREFTTRVKLLKDFAFAKLYNMAGDDHLDSAQTDAILDTVRYAPDLNEMPSPPLVNLHPAAWQFSSINLPLQDEHLPIFVEGVWFPVRIYDKDSAQKLVWYTRLRQDSAGQFIEMYAYDLKKTSLGYCSSTEPEYADPAVKKTYRLRKHFGCETVPQKIAYSQSLVAAFRGGYNLYDSATPDWTPFGIVSEGVIEVPATVGLLGLGVTPDNRVVMEPYQAGQSYRYYRQNGFPILQDGKVTASAVCEQFYFGDRKGSCSPQYGMRQAVGMTKDSRWLVVARSLSISSQSLAQALTTAGVKNAILLDQHDDYLIANITYNYPTKEVLPRQEFSGFNRDGLYYGGRDLGRFVYHKETRDFFYVYKK